MSADLNADVSADVNADVTASRILVIKLGALGDFVQAMGPFRAIRDFHRGAQITLLTTAPFAALARKCGYFDDVWVDERPNLLQLPSWRTLRLRLRGAGFTRVYDLQTSDRSGMYFRLFWPGASPEWSGIAGGCSHPHGNPERDSMHSLDRQAEQLARAGIAETPPPDLSWMSADISRFDLNDDFVLLAPGGAAHRPAKRWSAESYGLLVQHLAGQGLTPVLLGARDDAQVMAAITAACSQANCAARNLCGETELEDIAALARLARGAVGNDTGPMHVIAACGCPSLVLFSGDSDPDLCAPRGVDVHILRRDPLAELGVDEVASSLRLRQP